MKKIDAPKNASIQRGTAPMSFAVMTARTPATASAALASMAATRPCATGLRRMAVAYRLIDDK
jgi:hypothetical protein